MEPKNKLVTIDGEEIVIGGTYWSPYSYATHTMTAEVFERAMLGDLSDYDGYFHTLELERNNVYGAQVWFKFDNGDLLDQTRLASLAYKEQQVCYVARNHNLSLDEARSRFFPVNGVSSADLT